MSSPDTPSDIQFHKAMSQRDGEAQTEPRHVDGEASRDGTPPSPAANGSGLFDPAALEERLTLIERRLSEQADWHALEAASASLRKQAERLNEQQTEAEAANLRLCEEAKRLKSEKEALDERDRQVKKREDDVRLQEQLAARRLEVFERQVRAEVAADVATLQSRADGFEQRLLEERDRYQALWQNLAQTKEELAQSQGQDVGRLRSEKQALEELCARLEQKLADAPTAADVLDLNALRAEAKTWDRERRRMTDELARLRAAQGQWSIGVKELEIEVDRRKQAEQEVAAFKAESQRLNDIVARVQKLYAPPEEGERRLGNVKLPVLPYAAPSPVVAEQAWLTSVARRIKDDARFVYPERLLKAFHTALKAAEWSPLTVLAGVSGTGKSQLPDLYAHFGGLHFLSLPVQPNWDSPQSLFGFFNSIDNRFQATELLRAVAQMGRETSEGSGLKEQMMLVLLDEMNLAHVELYFSDLLSMLERRRGRADVTCPIDLGANVEPFQLPLGRNVLWAGTMNEDETTKTLSDKVTDRGNVLTFPRPRSLESRPKVDLPPRAAPLPFDAWRNWCVPSRHLDAGLLGKFKTTVEEINAALEDAGRALGHRVWQATEAYIGLHPDVIAARKDETALKAAMHVAFEDQLVMKVMPKLRGIETGDSDQAACLKAIRGVLPEALHRDFDQSCRGHGGFVWRGAAYLEGTA